MLLFRANIVTPVLYPRIMDARFWDCGPNLFLGDGGGGDDGGIDGGGGGGGGRDAKFCV